MYTSRRIFKSHSIIVANISNILIEHVVYFVDTTNKPLTNMSTYKSKYGEDITNYYSRTREGLVIKSMDHKYEDQNITSYITYTNFHEIRELLSEIETWLTDPKFDNLFKYTEDGKPFGVSEMFANLKYTAHLVGRDKKFIMGIPAMISHYDETYTGIRLKNEKGIIGDLTYSEFMNLKDLLNNLMNNFYSDSLNIRLKHMEKNENEGNWK